MGLQRGQRNEIFEAVQGVGLSPAEFDWEVADESSTVRHRSSGAYFIVERTAGEYSSRYLAMEGPLEERTGLSWYRVMQQVGFWLSQVKLDITTPDLWAQLQRETELLGAVSDEGSNTPFTPAEQEMIAGQLRELKDYLSHTHSLSESQTRLLEEKLDYLAAATKRVGRKDWLLMTVGVMLGYAIEAVLPPEAAKDIVGTLLRSVASVLGESLGLSSG